ncbi:Transferrin binding protein-like solute binding protein [Phocoenobacter uteri]|uniref:Transferrin binding protein-like solute binding protein n=1 Tax=Phocoenobacter uteri TaxID=146806 RepID=A0A379C976_9PAST|nr:transferrin-binding protein-like solute binding protein [Phocoenobacter uteri]MDG6882048.1 hypothetical protein [Phocoenobacter uteri]SUB58197.1 Transferrin binding protein-like solute binding protein [Phocoenobacter uteri]
MKKLVLATAISLVLAACGSGGGSGSTTPSENSLNTPHHSNARNLAANIIFSENYNKIDSETSEEDIGENDEYSTNMDLNKIEIEGRKITLIPVGISTKKLLIQQPDNLNKAKVVSGTQFQYSRFGFVDKHFFAQGDITPVNDLPTGKDVKYSGFVVATAVEDEKNSGVVTGDSSFTVNFDDKTLRGKFSNFEDGKIADFSQNARFQSNFFYGGMSGKFYGKNATELAGVLQTAIDSKMIFASFGAKKQ